MNPLYKTLAQILNLLVTIWTCVNKWTSEAELAPHRLTYQVVPSEPAKYNCHGPNYPLELPFHISDDPVTMTLCTRPSISHSTGLIPLLRWRGTTSSGRMRLGPDHRVFTVVFWHHFHCLWSIQRALNDRNDSYASHNHLHHCFKYLRQTLPCQVVDTLELRDFMEKDLANDRVGDTLICRDWQQVYAALDDNYPDWSEWTKEWS